MRSRLNNLTEPQRQVYSPLRIFQIFCFAPVDSPDALGYIAPTTLALVAELVDALVSGTSVARRGGSSPLLGTKVLQKTPQHQYVAGFLYISIHLGAHLFAFVSLECLSAIQWPGIPIAGG